MCRYQVSGNFQFSNPDQLMQSGFFFRHKLLKDYDWYWRLEPNVKFLCDITYDPFLYMIDRNKTYGFTLALFEIGETIPTLWEETRKFMIDNPHLVARNNALRFLSEDDGQTYNRCHFWSNFEIADLNWLRSSAYLAYFDALDRAGGFSYERWGKLSLNDVSFD